MAMNPNVGAANMNPMGGPVPGAPVPMMNNVAAPQAVAAAVARQQPNDSQRGILNTYIYEYFIRFGMYECARSLLSSEQQVNVLKDGASRRRDEAGNSVNGADDPMDTDSKSDFDSKLPDDLPIPRLPMPNANTSFLYEWFCLFWDVYNSSRGKSVNGIVHQYVAHTQSRFKQNQQHELLRQMRPDMAQQQYHIMRNMQGGNVNMGMKQGNLARAAMANNQHPQMMLQQAKHSQMQRDPSGLDANRDRPASPASSDNAPSPSKRQRIDGAGFNTNQPGAMMANGRPAQGIPGQQMATTATTAAAQHTLSASGINPGSLGPQQFQQFVNMPPEAQQKSIASYSHNLQQHHGTQMGSKQMPNAGGHQNQGSPMMPPGSDGSALGAFYNSADITGPPGIRPGPPGSQTGGSNHALQDYQMQLMLLEQQNKKRLMMARQEQDNMPMPRDPNGPGGPGGPGGPQGPNGQPFPEASPQTMPSGASPNPAEQMKRTPQMINSSIPSPVPEGVQSRGSPNPAINFIGNHVDPNMAPHFFKGMEGNMTVAQVQMNGGMRPPSSHPGQPFNGQMTPQHMMAARQQQQQQQQQGQQPQPGQQQGAQGTPQQWQQGPNGQMVSQGMQPQNQKIQGTPQQRSMPPPSAPAAAAAAVSNRTTASPQQATAAPPTPNQSNKPAPKKKETKAAKDKRAAAQKKVNHNAGATPAAGVSGEPDAPAPVTPITPVNPGFNKNGQNGGAANAQSSTAGPAPVPPATAAAPQVANAATMAAQGGQGDANPNGPMNIDNFNTMVNFGGMELANPLQSGDVLNDFDFDSFLHEDNNEPFDFNGTFPGMDGGEIGAD